MKKGGNVYSKGPPGSAHLSTPGPALPLCMDCLPWDRLQKRSVWSPEVLATVEWSGEAARCSTRIRWPGIVPAFFRLGYLQTERSFSMKPCDVMIWPWFLVHSRLHI